MALQTVNVYIMNTDPVPAVVPDVTVRVFESDDTTLVTEATTDGAGLASMTLDDAQASYILRFYRHGVAIPQPQSILMQAPWPLEIDVEAETFTHPVAPDQSMCRISGHLKNVYGMVPGRRRRFKVRAIRDPAIHQLDPNMLSVEPDEDVISDDNGYVVFDLFRGALHDVLVPGWFDQPILVEVPDRSWLDIVDLLFPTPALVDFDTDDPPTPITLGIDGTQTLHPRVKLSNDTWFADNRMDYETLQLQVVSEDEAIAQVNEEFLGASSEFVITGVGLGVTNIVVSIVNPENYFAKRVPEYPAQSVTMQVFVVT